MSFIKTECLLSPISFTEYSASSSFVPETSNTPIQLFSLVNFNFSPVVTPFLYSSTSIFSSGASISNPFSFFQIFFTLILLSLYVGDFNFAIFDSLSLFLCSVLPSIAILPFTSVLSSARLVNTTFRVPPPNSELRLFTCAFATCTPSRVRTAKLLFDALKPLGRVTLK